MHIYNVNRTSAFVGCPIVSGSPEVWPQFRYRSAAGADGVPKRFARTLFKDNQIHEIEVQQRLDKRAQTGGQILRRLTNQRTGEAGYGLRVVSRTMSTVVRARSGRVICLGNSPQMSTIESASATISTCCKTGRSATRRPTIPSNLGSEQSSSPG
jgi:hypothetical protein